MISICKIHDLSIIGLKFLDYKKELIDLNQIFQKTNKSYIQYTESRNIDSIFDFKNKFSKDLYTHFFFTEFMEFLGSDRDDYTPYFYSNTESKDKFRNSLVRKIRTIFGFDILETQMDLDLFYEKIESGDCSAITTIEGFLHSPKKRKRLKTVKKSLEREGLKFLHDVYFEEIKNKRILFC